MRSASFGLLLVLSGSLLSSDVSESDVLFLKIQELENELSILRNELENQAFLIEKLTSEIDTNQTEQLTEETDSNDLEVNFRFEGINDLQSMDEIYSNAISSLESGNLSQSKEFFDFFVSNFPDSEKTPLSLFWLGEIAFAQNDLVSSKNYFLDLITGFEDHWRVPVAHKRLGDISLKNDDIEEAKAKYKFVIQNYSDNSVSSIVLQILENME